LIPAPDSFMPIPTGDIAPPVLEAGERNAVGTEALPRILRQAAGTGLAARNVTMLTGLFLLVAILELALCLRLPRPGPVIVYGEFPRIILLEPRR